MRQYTNESQTAKLIELGFEKPRSIIDVWAHETEIDMEYEYEYAYSIGELIEMLPSRYDGEDFEINRDWRFERWVVFYRGDDATAATEIVDALYAMIIKLKEEGAI